NGDVWTDFTPTDITLPYDRTPDKANIEITLGYDAKPIETAHATTLESDEPKLPAEWAAKVAKLEAFEKAMSANQLADSYEAAHARLAREAIEIIPQRKIAVRNKQADVLPPASEKAAEQLYMDTANKLYDGLNNTLTEYQKSQEARKLQIARLWQGK